MVRSDFLVVGSGIAGLLFALKAAARGVVSVITKRGGSDTSTNLAQGGIAAVLDESDSFERHAEDTVRCGVGLCREDIVDLVVRDGPARIRELVEMGVEFTTEGGRPALGREGGHSANRIVHSRDLTGREIQRVLLERALREPNIRFYQDHMAVSLIQARHLRLPIEEPPRAVFGAYVLDVGRGRIDRFVAKRTVLATGGAGKVYLYTSNPDVATGDGIAIAYRAGARIANLEFVQFHPTCLYHPEAKSFLLTETLRGEGGVLRRADGSAFMGDYHDDRELAPRDIVARAIDREVKSTGAKCVFLDVTHLGRTRLQSRFPQIYERCRELGIDIAAEPIPVVPATHYFCGGIDVDADGRASLPNLFALGEVSHTGLHGANRLASNSLLEALVFANRTANHVMGDRSLEQGTDPEPLEWSENHAEAYADAVVVDHDWDEARRVLWDYVGIVRNDMRLELALERMLQLKDTVERLYWNTHLTQDTLELRNVILVGELVARCARQRKESRGLHFTETYPERDDARFRRDTILEGAQP